MCGICGIYLHEHGSPEAMRHCHRLVHRMTATLTHRGPDGSGVLTESPVVFGHRRLQILELSDAGAQPMRLEPRGAMLTYNGEIYNFRELRRALDRERGVPWRGQSDTEVVLRTYDAWGMDGLKRLEGMFAFALWDPARHRLVMMRDRLGVKPLYFADCTVGLAFGSEINAVLSAGGVDVTLDDQAFREYLWYGNSLGDRTFYKGIRQLLPGHRMVIERGRRSVSSWFKIEEWLEGTEPLGGIADAERRIRSSVDSAVSRQLTADVPVGLFLSGGLDSTAIAASVAALGVTAHSYTAVFDSDTETQDATSAQRVAQHLGLENTRIRINTESLWDTLERLVAAHGEPFADAANIPLYLLSQAINGHAKVVLQGDGGDEMFGGYRRYSLLSDRARWKLLQPCVVSLANRWFGGHGRLARLAHCMHQRDPALQMALLLTMETLDAPPEELLAVDRFYQLVGCSDPFSAYRAAADRFARHDPVQKMLLTDLTTQLPAQFLPKVDRATMAAGVEARVPLLDEQLGRLVVGMPSAWKAGASSTKALLRGALRGRAPASVVRARKSGFGVPYHGWLATQLHQGCRERLLDSGFLMRFGLDRLRVERLLSRRGTGWRADGFRLWKLLQLAIWHHRGSGAKVPEA